MGMSADMSDIATGAFSSAAKVILNIVLLKSSVSVEKGIKWTLRNLYVRSEATNRGIVGQISKLMMSICMHIFYVCCNA